MDVILTCAITLSEFLQQDPKSSIIIPYSDVQPKHKFIRGRMHASQRQINWQFNQSHQTSEPSTQNHCNLIQQRRLEISALVSFVCGAGTGVGLSKLAFGVADAFNALLAVDQRQEVGNHAFLIKTAETRNVLAREFRSTKNRCIYVHRNNH